MPRPAASQHPTCSRSCRKPRSGARVGLFGGSFDPVHLGHLLLAQAACEALALDRVWFVPSCRPPHKRNRLLAPAAARVEMLRLALAGDARFAIEPLELERGGVSFAVDTLRALHARHPGIDWVFLMGLDSLRELHLWREVASLLELCTFATFMRPGIDRPVRAAELALPPPWPGRLMAAILPGRSIEISSSEIRARVAAGRPIRYLVPDPVARYIRAQGLYRHTAHPAAAVGRGGTDVSKGG